MVWVVYFGFEHQHPEVPVERTPQIPLDNFDNPTDYMQHWLAKKLGKLLYRKQANRDGHIWDCGMGPS